MKFKTRLNRNTIIEKKREKINYVYFCVHDEM